MPADGIYAGLLRRGVSRRSFLRFSGAMAAALALPASYGARIAAAVEVAPRIPLVWLRGQACGGDSAAFLQATEPTVSELLLELLSVDYADSIMASSGTDADGARASAIGGATGYLAVVEGSIPPAADGTFCIVGGRAFADVAREVCAGALATVAVGSCAFDGGISAASGGSTAAQGAGAVARPGTLINLPGCPVNVENLTATLVHYLTFKELPPTDGRGRPLFAYGGLIHNQCERRAHFEFGEFVLAWGDEAAQKGWCLYKMGCKGPETFANCPTVGYAGGTSWAVQAGHGCIGCTMPGFWDSMGPAYSRLPPPLPFAPNVTTDQIGQAAVAGVAALTLAHGAASWVRGRRAAQGGSTPEQRDADRRDQPDDCAARRGDGADRRRAARAHGRARWPSPWPSRPPPRRPPRRRPTASTPPTPPTPPRRPTSTADPSDPSDVSELRPDDEPGVRPPPDAPAEPIEAVDAGRRAASPARRCAGSHARSDAPRDALANAGRPGGRAMTRLAIDPVSRVNGHLRIEADVPDRIVADAWVSGQAYRGIERILSGRDPRDAWLVAQRVCGVCTGAHAFASVRAVENALEVSIPANARLIRNIMAGSSAVVAHAAGFYLRQAFDWVDPTIAVRADPRAASALAATLGDRSDAGEASFRSVRDRLSVALRDQTAPFASRSWGHPAYSLPPEASLMVLAHYFEAIDWQREMNRLQVVLGGKSPHPQTLLVGGMAVAPPWGGPSRPDAGQHPWRSNRKAPAPLSAEGLADVAALLEQARSFVHGVYVPDVLTLAEHYGEWARVGLGIGHYLSFGAYPEDGRRSAPLLPRGRVMDRGLSEVVDVGQAGVAETVAHAHYLDDGRWSTASSPGCDHGAGVCGASATIHHDRGLRSVQLDQGAPIRGRPDGGRACRAHDRRLRRRS